LFREYENSQDIDHAAAEFLEICKSTGVEKFMAIGYILNNAFAQKLEGWQQFSSLVVDHFYTGKGLIQGSDLVER
jgi:hypothetical protein